MGKKQRSEKPRTVVLKFSFYLDKEVVWPYVKNLKGTGVGLSHDYPKEMDDSHANLYPVLKKTKQQKQSVIFKVDKLIIIMNGQVYRGVKTENLSCYVNSNPADGELSTPDW